MTQYALLALDLVAISVLAFGVYFPRHRRRDLVVAYLGVNVGVLAVATALAEQRGRCGPRARAVRRAVDHPAAVHGADPARGGLLLLGAGARAAGRAGGHAVGAERRADGAGRRRSWPSSTTRGCCGGTGSRRWCWTRRSPTRPRSSRTWSACSAPRVHTAIVQRVDLVNDTTCVDVRYELRPPVPRAGPGMSLDARSTSSSSPSGRACRPGSTASTSSRRTRVDGAPARHRARRPRPPDRRRARLRLRVRLLRHPRPDQLPRRGPPAPAAVQGPHPHLRGLRRCAGSRSRPAARAAAPSRRACRTTRTTATP